MTKATKAAVNKALKAAGIIGEIVKGEGYFYFSGESFDGCRVETGVYTSRITDISVEGWVIQAIQKINS